MASFTYSYSSACDNTGIAREENRNYAGTFLAPPAAALEKEGGFCEDTSRSGRGTQSPCTPC